MSVISHIHTATVYDPKHSKAFDGQRLIVTIAKKDKDGNYGPHLQQTMATSVPTLTSSDIDFANVSVQNLCIDYFRSVQNAIVSDRIKAGTKTVTTEELGQTAIVNYLLSESVGDKWDSSRIGTWFTEVLAEHIGVALIDKGFDDTRLEAGLKAYEKLISECLSSKVALPRKKAEAISKAFALVPEGAQDATFARFNARIQKARADQNLDELLGL